MEVIVSYDIIPLSEMWICRWDILNPDEDDLKYYEEIKQEMDLNITNQYHSVGKLW